MDSAESEEKVLRCDVCSRTFSFPETLANHQLMHETPVKSKTQHNKQKTKKSNKRIEDHHPYIRRTSPENVVPNRPPNVAQEIVISDVTSQTWTYHVEPPKREVIKEGVRYHSENVSWPYNPEYFKKFTEPPKQTQSDVFIPSRVAVCYNEPTKGYQHNEPMTSNSDDITWASQIDDCKPPMSYQETLMQTVATNQTSNTVESVSFSTANETSSVVKLESPEVCTSIQTSAPAQQESNHKDTGTVQLNSNTEASLSQGENPTKTPTIFSGNDDVTERDKLYRCGLCWKTFSYLETLSNHMLGHRERAVCLCNVCGKEFDYLPNLDAHVTSHKPYRCVSCGQRFRLWNCAKDHAETHAKHDGGILEDYITYVS